MPVRLEPAALRSRVKHSTTEPLRSHMLMLPGTIAHSMIFNELEKNKNEDARIVTVATKLVSIYALLSTRQETLSSRRKEHKLILFYKMKNNLCPSYLVSLVPNNVGAISRYNIT